MAKKPPENDSTESTGEELISSRQAAAIIGCGIRTLQRYAQYGMIEGTRLPGPNGQYVFSRKEIEAYRAKLEERWREEYE